MTMDRNHFEMSGIWEKLLTGPIEPSPGPTSLKQVIIPLSDSTNPKPVMLRKIEPITIIII